MSQLSLLVELLNVLVEYESMIAEGWARDGENFSAELSDFNASGVSVLKCPGCKKPLPAFENNPRSKGPWKVDTDGEDVYGWRIKHECGAQLLLVND